MSNLFEIDIKIMRLNFSVAIGKFGKGRSQF